MARQSMYFFYFDPTFGQFQFYISKGFFGMEEASESSDKVIYSPLPGLKPIRRLRKPTSFFKIGFDSSPNWLWIYFYDYAK